MPGIAGLITKLPRRWAEPRLQRMIEALRHEPFYRAGTWIDEPLGVYAGWVAREGSFSDGMPLRNERGDLVLVFSGEEYPEPGAAQRLKERGHDLVPPSYLVHYAGDDRAFPAGLNGLFHGLLADRARERVTLFNDRYGMHRLYYHESKEAFFFAAEAKAILAVRPDLRRLDPKALGEFIALSCVLEDRTIFQSIFALPGGSAWVFKDGAVEAKRAYFSPREWEEQEPLDPESYYGAIREAFSRNLPRYFRGSEKTGIALTGGLDTRAIMAWHKPAPGSLPCYTFGGSLRESEDVAIARRIAERCAQPHQVITVGNEYLSRFPHYAERTVFLTEGSVDVFRSSDLYVSEKAREIAPAKVVGTYGSEIVRHAVMFRPDRLAPCLFARETDPLVDEAEATYSAVSRAHPVTFAAFRQSPWYHHGILLLEESQLSVRSPYLDNDFVRAVYREPKSAGPSEDVRLRLIGDGSPSLASIRSDRGVGGRSNRIGSLAARALLEFTFKAEYAYDLGMPQWLARVDHLLSPFHFERLFLGRHKLLHFRTWYRDQLAGYVRETLLDPRSLSRPYVERKAVEAVVLHHLKGNRNYTTEIQKLLTLELLHRLFLDQPAQGGSAQESEIPVASRAES